MTDPSSPRGAAPTIPHARRQLTLFVPATAAATLEALRLRLDPIQAALIAAHVTLCRPRARVHWAHITLAHPRNPRAPTNVDPELAALPPTLCLEFPTVTLIEQVAGAPWTALREAWLGAAHGRA